jgi:hypothetical protein
MGGSDTAPTRCYTSSPNYPSDPSLVIVNSDFVSHLLVFDFASHFEALTLRQPPFGAASSHLPAVGTPSLGNLDPFQS